MKITKRQLRRIVKQEKRKVIKEQGMPGIDKAVRDLWGDKPSEGRDVGDYQRDVDDWVDTLGQLIDQDMTSRGVWYEDEGEAILTALEHLRREIKDELRGPTR